MKCRHKGKETQQFRLVHTFALKQCKLEIQSVFERKIKIKDSGLGSPLLLSLINDITGKTMEASGFNLAALTKGKVSHYIYTYTRMLKHIYQNKPLCWVILVRNILTQNNASDCNTKSRKNFHVNAIVIKVNLCHNAVWK